MTPPSTVCHRHSLAPARPRPLRDATARGVFTTALHGRQRTSRLLVAAIFLSAAIAGAAAEPLVALTDPSPAMAVTPYDLYSGLPHHAVPVMVQTRDGYLWFGTESGLARFDGVRFTTFRTSDTPELPANLIRRLWEAPDGWLWIATQSGVCRYRDNRFEAIGLDGERATALAGGRNGEVWIGTSTRGVVEYRNGTLVEHAHSPGMPADRDVRHLLVDSQGALWVAFRSAGVFRFAAGRATPFRSAPPNVSDFMHVAESPAGTLWFGTERSGILRVRDDDVRLYTTAHGLDSNTLRSLYADRHGRIWAITNSPFYLDHADDDHFTRVPLPQHENCRDMIEDREGSYWIGSAGDGVARIRPSGFHMLSGEQEIFGGNTRVVMVDGDGTAWVGLASTGVARVSPDGRLTVLSSDQTEVWSVWHASNGDVWIGTRGPLLRWREGRVERFPALQRTRAIYEDRDRTVWIGSETGGVTRYQNGEFTSMNAAIQACQVVPLALPLAMAFSEAEDGTLYIGLRNTGGLVMVKDGVFRSRQDLPSNDIRAIYHDREGHVWVGTKGRGLVLGVNGSWLNPETLSEPLNDQVSAVIEDRAGRIWLGTPKGIVWTTKSHLLALAHGRRSNETYHLAGTGEGVRPGTVGAGSFPAASQAPDGRLWFATRHGITVVDPTKVTRNEVVPPVHIERVLIDNQAFPVKPGQPIRVPPGTRSLAIEYTALSFVGPSQVLFRYRLHGRDTDWTDAGTRRTAFYSEIAPGSYEFQVIGCNNDAVWNETGAGLAVEQLPHFYQTAWFYTAIGVGLLGFGFGFFQWRTASLRNRNQDLQNRIAERTAELAKSYEKIRASEFFYHSLVESLPQSIVRKDVNGRYTYVNAGFAELVGRPADSIVGLTAADLLPPAQAEKSRIDDARVMQTGEPIEYETVVERGGQKRYLHVKNVPLRDEHGGNLGVQLLFWDMTTFREIEEKLRQAQHELLETSRLAGVAEMATGILHNLGNALNSVNTTATLAATRIRSSKVNSVAKVAELLEQQNGHLAEFFTEDQRGRQLPVYLAKLGGHLSAERDELLRDLDALRDSVSHIKELVAAQQQFARGSGVDEIIPAAELVEFAIRLTDAAMMRHNVTVVRELMSSPPVRVQRHKALQIIGNLLNNAKDAVKEGAREDRRVTIGVRLSAGGNTQIYVTDNGVGIPPENLTRIFAFGFTTKSKGHGFGLHSSAIAAKELGGTLTARSDGPGRGATFVLELPPAT